MVNPEDILKASILIVDDLAANVLVLEGILSQAGYASVACTNEPREVCALHRKNRYDLILLDLQMPEMDGFEVMKGLKEIEAGGSLPVLVLTAQPDHKLRALEAGARDMVNVPFDRVEVLLRVHNLLEVHLLHRQLTLHNAGRLENSQRIANLGDWEHDFPKNHLVWSDEIYRILGLTRKDNPPNSETFYRLVHPQDLAYVHREKKAASNGQRRVSFEHRIIRTDGEIRNIHQIAELTFDEKGLPTGESGTIQDVTERTRTEENLRQKEAQFNGLTSSIPDHIYFKDRESRFVRINEAQARTLGLHSPDEAVGRTDFDYYDQAHASKAYADDQRVMATGELLVGVEEKETWPDGRITWASTTKVPLYDYEGRVTGLVGISRNITEQKKMEEHLRRSQRLEAIGSLASGVAHDMNNILAPMLMAAGILKDKLPEARDREILGLVERGAQRGASIIRQLLTFSSGIEGARDQVHLQHMLQEMDHLMRETFPRNLKPETDVPSSLWTVLADPTQLHQVIMNLCVNARDAMPDGGKLTLTAANIQLDDNLARIHPDAKPGPYVLLTVADTGSGIPPEIIERIFDPFFTTKGVGKGTGLGLSTVIGIVKSHGGFITVYSEPGRGTAFRVYLPATGRTDSAEAHGSRAPIPQGNHELILVVDDEAPILAATSGALTKFDYRVLTAGSGEEAIKIFIQHCDSIRLVITDIMMPGVGGAELIRSLRIIKPDIDVIATSGLEQISNRPEFAALGVKEILSKPCTPGQLIKAVNRTLREAVPALLNSG